MHANTRIGAVNICTMNADLVNVPNTMSYTHIHIRIHTRMHAHTNAQMRTRTHAYAKAHTDTRTCTYAFKHTGARGHARSVASEKNALRRSCFYDSMLSPLPPRSQCCQISAVKPMRNKRSFSSTSSRTILTNIASGGEGARWWHTACSQRSVIFARNGKGFHHASAYVTKSSCCGLARANKSVTTFITKVLWGWRPA